jgi:SulP family sulfate permease
MRLLIPWVEHVNRSTLKPDIIAGITNAFIVLPQGIAFAMIAGLPPVYGLYTAIVPAIIAAVFGSSRHLISGPTTAISIVVFSTISPYAEAGSAEFLALVFLLTFLAGLAQFILGIARMGVIINYISHTVVIGFTAGAAILIATSQIKNCLDLAIPQGTSFLNTYISALKLIGETNLYALFISVFTLTTIIMLKHWKPNWPGLLFAMVAGSFIAGMVGVAQHEIKLVAPVNFTLPPLSVPDFSMSAIKTLSSGAIAVAMLGLIEAVSIARSIAIKSKQQLDGNREFIGQGLSNIVGSFFSCYASSGSFTRSGINYASGAKTPMAAIFAAISLTLIMLLIAPVTSNLPIPVIGGIVLYVAYNLIDFHSIRTVLKTNKSESAVLITTFLSTLFIELEFAIYIGIILSLVFYLMQTSNPRIVSRVPNPSSSRRAFTTSEGATKCPQLEIIRIDGSIYFGSVDSIRRGINLIENEYPDKLFILIVCNGINFIDFAGAEMLAHEAKRFSGKGGGLHLCKVKPRVAETLRKGGHWEEIGAENIHDSKEDAISAIAEKLSADRCMECDENIFLECKDLKSGEPHKDSSAAKAQANAD